MRFAGLFVFCLCSIASVQGQHYAPLGDYTTNVLSGEMYRDSNSFTGIRPYRFKDISAEHLAAHKFDTTSQRKWNVYPIVNASFGVANEVLGARPVTTGMLGVGVSSPSNGLWFAEFNGYAGMVDVPNFAEDELKVQNAFREAGWARPNGKGYDTYQFTGYAGRQLGQFVDVEIGRGKHFFGDGHRSLLLSGEGMPYSYGKITTEVWKLKYVNLYTALDELSGATARDWSSYNRKFAAMHYLSWNAANWLNISLFEAVVWRSNDTLVQRGFDPAYLNPVIFYRPVEYYGGSSDNSLIGLNVLVKPGKGWGIYGQLTLDEFLLAEVQKDVKHLVGKNDNQWGWWANKQSMQLGLRKHGLGKWRFANALTEINIVRPFMYSHSNTLENYAHFNLPLAHPAGANFYEWIGKFWVAKEKHYLESAAVCISQGLDNTNGVVGSDVNRRYFERSEEYGYFIGRGLRRTLWNLSFRYAYRVRNQGNLNAFVLLQQRFESVGGVQQNATFVQIGIKSQLFRGLYDN